jgi:predicted nuclease of predicted toxin-antitoxin system
VKLLLDEMLAPAIARELRSRGHDVESVGGRSEWQALSDAEVVEVARRERRAIVTNNLRDFRPLHHEAIVPGGPGHFGMVFVPGSYRRTKADIGMIVNALERKLAEYPGEEDLAGGETWL